MQNDAELERIIRTSQSVAVVGASARPERPSHRVTRYLRDRTHFRVLPVNPNYPEVVGLPCVPSLENLPEVPDLVDVFRRSEHVPALVEAAIQVGAKVVWLQLGVHDDQAVRRAQKAGLEVVEDRCLMTEHRRLVG